MQQLHQFFFINVLSPVAQNCLKCRRTAGVFGTLAGVHKQPEFLHGWLFISIDFIFFECERRFHLRFTYL
jgi:hypothetical protein